MGDKVESQTDITHKIISNSTNTNAHRALRGGGRIVLE